MKLKSWMEAHIVLHTKWKKKEKRKKASESKSETPSATLPSWRTSNFLHFFMTTGSAASRQSKTLPEQREKDGCGKSQRAARNFVAPADFSSGNAGRNTPTPAFVDDSCGNSPSVLALRPHLAEQLDCANLNSPRQRNKIRTNPWLTPKQQRSFPSGCPGSDCSSCSGAETWRSSCLSGSTAESSRDSYSVCGGEPLAVGRAAAEDLHPACQESSAVRRAAAEDDSYPACQESSAVRRAAPEDYSYPACQESSAVRRAATEDDSYPACQESSAVRRVAAEDYSCPARGGAAAVRRDPAVGEKKERQKRGRGKTDNDSDSEECETLSEMGNFDEHYDEYDWETVESDILGESGGNRRRPSRRRGCPVSAPPCKWRDLRSDEDYSEKLDYADEAYSEMSGSAEERLSDGDEKDKRECSPEADSAFPSESEPSSVATTPLMEGVGGGATSSSGSDSGIQRHAGWSCESGRNLRCVRDSLEDKVRNLRFERLVVEDKIREAKEEDAERREEKERFRRESVLHRRQVLLRTLDQLRLKLEDQGARLQEAYHSTLEMQLNGRRQLATVVEENAVSAFGRTTAAHEKLL